MQHSFKYLLVLVPIVFLSCINPYDYIREPSISFTSLEEIYEYVETLRYVPDAEEYWQAPQETINRGTGDCEDMAIFIIYFASRDLGMKVKLVGIHKANGTNHALAKLDNKYYEVYTMRTYDEESLDIYMEVSLNYALTNCVYNGSRQAY